MPVGVGLEPRGPVAEAAVGVGERAHAVERAVPDPHGRDGLRDLLAVGADVLDRRRADPARDARQRLDADPAALDGEAHEVVPGLTGRDLDEHAAARGVVGDSGRVDPGSRPRPPVPSKPSSATTRLLPPPTTSTAAGRVQRRGHLGLGRGRDPLARRTAEPQGGVVGERQAQARTTALGMPSTFCPSQVTVSATVVSPSVGLLGLAGDLDVHTALGRDHDRAGELAAEAHDLGAAGTTRRPPGRPAPSCTCRARSRRAGRRCGATSSSWWIGFWSPLASAYAHQVGAGDREDLRLERHARSRHARRPGARGWRWSSRPARRTASVTSLVVPMMSLPRDLAQARDGQRRGQHVAGDDRPLVGELLLAVHDPEQVDRLGLEERVHGVEGQDDRVRRGRRRPRRTRRPTAAAKSRSRSSVTSYAACGWEGPADERLVDGHAATLSPSSSLVLALARLHRRRGESLLRRRKRGPTTAPAEACGPLTYAEVRGRAPSYGPRPLGRFANDHAMCAGVWAPGADRWLVPQGMAVAGDGTAYLAGFDGTKPARQRYCSVERIDLRTGRLMVRNDPVRGCVGGAAPIICRHGGGLRARRARAVAGRDGPPVAARPGDARGAAGSGRSRRRSAGRSRCTTARAGWGSAGSPSARTGRSTGSTPRPCWRPARSWSGSATPRRRCGRRVGRRGPCSPTSTAGAPALWFVRSHSACGVLVGPRRQRRGFIPGGESMSLDQDGRLWVASRIGVAALPEGRQADDAAARKVRHRRRPALGTA